jgi:hypothetical protein
MNFASHTGDAELACTKYTDHIPTHAGRLDQEEHCGTLEVHNVVTIYSSASLLKFHQ